jgi:hypothetical protein
MEDYPLELLFKDTERDVLLFRVKNIPEGRILPFSSDLV